MFASTSDSQVPSNNEDYHTHEQQETSEAHLVEKFDRGLS